MLDYLIIGQGVAGSVFARILDNHNKSFLIIDHEEEKASSRVAGGVFNPVTGKRVVKTWLADTIFPFAIDFYSNWEKDLNVKVVCPKPLYKPYQNISEQNDVFAKSEKESIKGYLNLEANTAPFKNFLHQDLGAVEILKGGNIKLAHLLDTQKEDYSKSKKYIRSDFDASQLIIHDDYIEYKDIKAKKVILSQGHQATQNNLFDWLPWTLTKGEILEINIPNFPESHIINKGGFVLPIGNDNFIAGASYERKINKEVSEKGRNIVLEKLDKILKVDFKIIKQRVGIRPTVRDRRPFLGEHPQHKNLFIFNGLGTKGVTLAPYFGDMLFKHIEHGDSIHKEVDIIRYNDFYPVN